MNYNYLNFLRPIFENSRNIQIIDSNGEIKYTINPFFIVNSLASNNLVKINLKNDKIILLNFNNSTEARTALFELQKQIDQLTKKTPIVIEKNIENYVENISQSWYENINTPLGEVTIFHNSQEEFYDGEFSGSVILVTTQSLAQPYTLENVSRNYKHVYYYETTKPI
jgi:hypothetical protein